MILSSRARTSLRTSRVLDRALMMLFSRHEVALAPPRDHLLLLGVEDLDPVVVHRGEEIVEVLLGVQVVGEGLVDLLEEQEALLPPLGDELGDFVLVELDVRRHAAHLFRRGLRYDALS
ncbi:MAG: hypothetical protein ABR951_11210 [Candidatus Aminicenantales bacterium]